MIINCYGYCNTCQQTSIVSTAKGNCSCTNQGVNQVQIVARFLHEDNVKISRQTVNATVKKQRAIDRGSFPVPKKRGPTARLNG